MTSALGRLIDALARVEVWEEAMVSGPEVVRERPSLSA
jgi:hypothetical protein